ncbi:histidine kinase [Burkholderia lata]|uniref:histidine kinase n=1 Tax=Burkholderia lata (strain ATCC 17760 / DSM 23089 / LMG 22485 / NCIMB 9086 / R18194 / 383) TaxID=482957 RepID=A0A6P2ZXS8_BURL3|nr:HAMP domain-containing sensor histidine kinase [Burkholderia lata]VWD36416.1 histidine kinase [Burkholderia lata]
MKHHLIDMFGRFLGPVRRRACDEDTQVAGHASSHRATGRVRLTSALVLVCAVLTATHALHRVDRAWFEFVSQSVHRGAVEPLAVIEVDDRTTERLGNWPFSVATRERMMSRLAGSGVAVVSIDLSGLRDVARVRAGHPATGETASRAATRTEGGIGNAVTACAPDAALHWNGPCERYSYVKVLDGDVPSNRLGGRAVVIRAAAEHAESRQTVSSNDALGIGDDVAAAGASGAPAMALPLHQTGFAWALLFNETVVCVMCLLLDRLGPRAGLVASFGVAGAIAAIAFALFAVGGEALPPATGVLMCVLACLLWFWRRVEVLLRFIGLLGDRMATEPSLRAKSAEVARYPDPVQRQLDRTANLDAQVRRYRALVDAWVDSLPEATLIASAAGVVLLANQRIAALCADPGEHPGPGGAPVGRLVSDVLFQITASHRANEFVAQALTLLDHWPDGDALSAHTKSRLDQGIEIANARCGRSLLIKCAPIRPSVYGERALVFHVADVSSVRMVERQRDMALRFLSHDMRSPQASILALVSQIQRDPSRYTAQRFAELVSQYATRALSLSDDFLFLARAENLPPKLAAVDPALVLGDAVDDLLPQANAKSTTVNLMAEPGFSTIADVQLLRRAFVNLIGNAIKFGREASTVDVELSATNRHVKIAVTDYGAGISERDQEKLFREFTQLDGSASMLGHGLGLAFVKTVVDSLGGKLQVRSTLGEGTTFLMFLSRHDHDTAPGH